MSEETPERPRVGRKRVRGMRPMLRDGANGSRQQPAWWERAIMLRAQRHTTRQIAEKLGKGLKTVENCLGSAFARETLAAIDARAREHLIQNAVDPRVKAQLESPAAMERIIKASVDAEKPMEIAAINKMVLDYGGYAPAEKKVVLSITAAIDDLPPDALEEWERTGVMPAAVAAFLPPPDVGSD